MKNQKLRFGKCWLVVTNKTIIMLNKNKKKKKNNNKMYSFRFNFITNWI